MWEQLSRLGNILAMDPAWPGLGLATWVMKLGCTKQVRVRWELCVLLEYATHTQFKYSAYLGGDTGGMRISLISWSGIELGTEKNKEMLLESISCWPQVTQLLSHLKAFMFSLFMKFSTSELFSGLRSLDSLRLVLVFDLRALTHFT